MTESIGKEFMRFSASDSQGPTRQEQGEPQPPLELPYPPEASLITLPAADELTAIPEVALREAMDRRVTLRRYGEEGITLEELAYLLWYTQGVRAVTDRPITLRLVPSAGARHAFETYLLINKVAGLEPGLYRYIALEHALIFLELGEAINEVLTHACLDQKQIKTSAVTFFWVAVAERMTYRYGERGYRYLHLDAGHICQNLYLAAEAIRCGVCAIGAFHDAQVNAALQLNGEALFAVYGASLGRRNEPQRSTG
jgi:SagB-type dehydrogenase family enzyme